MLFLYILILVIGLGRIVFLNAFSLSMIDHDNYTLIVEKKDPALLRNIVKKWIQMGYDVCCYIRHESTLNVINEFFGFSLAPSSDIYKHEDKDIMIVASLKQPARGREVQVQSIDDLDFYLIRVIK
ncbi:MAG: hypothetical protein DRJ60_03190 [Thermoprotei archaeon]|nr:MAG: hypothetical protein DRJ60_03190 [Thermoprotei archaeon]